MSDARLDPTEARLAARRVPCICPRQHEPNPPVGVTVAIGTQRGAAVERVRCSACLRTWTRSEA